MTTTHLAAPSANHTVAALREGLEKAAQGGAALRIESDSISIKGTTWRGRVVLYLRNLLMSSNEQRKNQAVLDAFRDSTAPTEGNIYNHRFKEKLQTLVDSGEIFVDLPARDFTSALYRLAATAAEQAQAAATPTIVIQEEPSAPPFVPEPPPLPSPSLATPPSTPERPPKLSTVTVEEEVQTQGDQQQTGMIDVTDPIFVKVLKTNSGQPPSEVQKTPGNPQKTQENPQGGAQEKTPEQEKPREPILQMTVVDPQEKAEKEAFQKLRGKHYIKSREQARLIATEAGVNCATMIDQWREIGNRADNFIQYASNPENMREYGDRMEHIRTRDHDGLIVMSDTFCRAAHLCAVMDVMKGEVLPQTINVKRKYTNKTSIRDLNATGAFYKGTQQYWKNTTIAKKRPLSSQTQPPIVSTAASKPAEAEALMPPSAQIKEAPRDANYTNVQFYNKEEEELFKRVAPVSLRNSDEARLLARELKVDYNTLLNSWPEIHKRAGGFISKVHNSKIAIDGDVETLYIKKHRPQFLGGRMSLPFQRAVYTIAARHHFGREDEPLFSQSLAYSSSATIAGESTHIYGGDMANIDSLFRKLYDLDPPKPQAGATAVQQRRVANRDLRAQSSRFDIPMILEETFSLEGIDFSTPPYQELGSLENAHALADEIDVDHTEMLKKWPSISILCNSFVSRFQNRDINIQSHAPTIGRFLPQENAEDAGALNIDFLRGAQAAAASFHLKDGNYYELNEQPYTKAPPSSQRREGQQGGQREGLSPTEASVIRATYINFMNS